MDIATTYRCARQSTVGPSAKARVILLKLIVVLLLFGSVMATVAVKRAERVGHYSSPHLLLYIWVSDALLIWLALWQIKRLNSSNCPYRPQTSPSFGGFAAESADSRRWPNPV